ncbi:PREDICTED: odorant receptor 9a-like [Trachymyrmex cornetzi]|uniref:odorant receptor 9a-like n=1 Tax=Trachymyrmex cornetzi TaxID=471704 RepID=UPI00084F22F5|nr:PREDICTED: odorant receptor 9a-like [Trachymyrmex cornetzi]
MKKYATNARLISFAYVLYVYLTSNTFMLLSLVPKLLNIVLPLNESRPITFPYDVCYFVDEEKYYFYIILHIYVGGNISLTAVIAHDCTFFIYIEHVCSLFAVAGFRLETLSRKDHNDENNLSHNRKIAVSIHAHWRALRFAKILEDIFCTAFAVQMLIVTVTLTITLLQVALHYGDINEMFKYLVYIFGQVLHTFCYSLQGQRLINHSIQMRDKIYNSSWYEIPAESRKLLLFVMRRSMEPCFLSAGKIYVFSLKSFTTVNII